MKHAIGLLILFISFNAQAISIKNEMYTIMNQSAATWNRGDLNAFLTIYKKSDETRYISNDIIKGYSNISKHYLEKYSDREIMGKLDFKIDSIKALSRHYTFVIGKWHLVRSNSPDANGIFTLLFEKVGSDWKIIVDHSS